MKWEVVICPRPVVAAAVVGFGVGVVGVLVVVVVVVPIMTGFW